MLFGHVGGPTGVELANDEQTVLTGGRDGNIKRWNVSSGALLQTFSAGVGPVEAMQLSPDGTRLAVAGNTARIIDAATGTLVVPITVPVEVSFVAAISAA